MSVVPEVAHHMALLPLAWLGWLASNGHRRPVLWWALALVLSVSWIADTAAHWVDPWLVSALYPAAQAVVLGMVLLPGFALGNLLWIVLGATAVPLLWRSEAHPEVFAHTVAWTALVVIAWPHRDLRAPVVVTFGLGWLAWLGYNMLPSWGTWGAYQGVRALGLGAFCWATLSQRVRA